MEDRTVMKTVVWFLILLLVVLHQDIWNWADGRLVFGFLPVGLAYHVVLSLAAASVWLMAVQFAWPEDDDVEPKDESAGHSHSPSLGKGGTGGSA